MLKNLYRWPASQWINKQNAFHGIAGSPIFTGSLQFPGASFSRFLNIIFITVVFEAIEHGRPSNRPPIVQFTNVLGNGCFVSIVELG